MADTTETGAAPAGKAQAKVRMVPSAQAPDEIYVDGVAGAMGRGGVLKIDLYRVSGIERETNTELHRISHRLVIPAGAVSELVRVLQGTVEAARKASEARQAKS